MTVLDNIDRTRLMPLQHIVPTGSARILLKLEYENPTGSMKDRMALALHEGIFAGTSTGANVAVGTEAA